MSAYRKSSGYLEKASDILKENHRRFMESDGFQYFLFRQKWPSFAGELLVRESYIAGASGEVLYVQVTNSVWLSQLTMLKAQILEKINKDPFGARFTDIRFRIGPKQTKNQPRSTLDPINRAIEKEKQRMSQPLNESEKQWIDQWVAGHVTDERLGPVFEKLMTGSLKKRKGELAAGYHPCPGCSTLIPPEKKVCQDCGRKISIARRNRIIALLKKHPHYGYEMTRQVIPSTYREYAEAHEFLEIKLEQAIYDKVNGKENRRMLLALLTHKPMEEITEEEAREKLERLREKVVISDGPGD